MSILKNFLARTLAVSFLPGWVVGAEIKNGTLQAVPPGPRPFEQTWGLTYARSRPLNHIEATLCKLCAKQAGEMV